MRIARSVFEVKAAIALRDDRRMYRELTRQAVLPREALAALQAERALAHARFAMEHSPFYRERYRDAGFTLQDLCDPSVFTDLPIISKADVREHSDLFRSDEATPSNSKVSSTGGSTGEPLRLLRDLRTPTRTLEWRLFDWWGVHPSDNIAILQRKIRTPFEQRKYRALWWPSRRIQLDAFRMDEEHITRFLEEWEQTKPQIFVGYVGGIAELARLLLHRNITPHRPTAVATTAAPLTEAHRVLIQRAFGAPVYDHYRSSEVPWIAGECRERNGLHVFADVRKVELIGEDDKPVSPGEPGEVVATDLTNRVFPLIRYRLGDRTSEILEDCPCGVTLPRIRPVSGRVSDVFRLPDGRIVPGEPLAQTFSRTPDAVREFQIHQLPDCSIVVRCVPNDTPGALAEIDQAMDRFRDVFQHAVPIRLELLDHIAHDGGKIRFIKSDAR